MIIRVAAQLPDGSSLNRTLDIAETIQDELLSIDGISDSINIVGYNPITGALQVNVAAVFAVLSPWEYRRKNNETINNLIMEAQEKTAYINGAAIGIFNAPPVRGLSSTGGFQLEIQDTHNSSFSDLYNSTQKIIDQGNSSDELQSLFSTFEINFPQYYVDLDRVKAKTMGINISDVFKTHKNNHHNQSNQLIILLTCNLHNKHLSYTTYYL